MSLNLLTNYIYASTLKMEFTKPFQRPLSILFNSEQEEKIADIDSLIFQLSNEIEAERKTSVNHMKANTENSFQARYRCISSQPTQKLPSAPVQLVPLMQST